MNKKVKRIAAIIALVLFASIFLVTFISAFFASKNAPGLFLASLFCAIVIPIIIWAFMLFYRLIHRNTPKGYLEEDEDSVPVDETELFNSTTESDSNDNNE